MITDTHKQVPLPLERSKGSVCVQSLDDSRELRVTLTIAVNCVLHRYKTLVIHRKASILSVVIVTEGKVRCFYYNQHPYRAGYPSTINDARADYR
jgi:hypothetical protein